MIDLKKLDSTARNVRKHIITMSYNARSAHMGGSLSCVEILVYLYFSYLKVFPDNPNNRKRDRFILSKAHDAKALYATLAERGYITHKVLESYEQNDGKLPGHTVRHCVAGVESSAGSLGHGLSIGTGIALAGKLNADSYRVIVLLSDGECDEGSIWEAALFASQHKLTNLTAIVDYNKLQGFGRTDDVISLEPFRQKWESFGWNVIEIKNGNNFNQIYGGFKQITKKNKPTCIIAHTTKGLGGPKKYVNTIDSQYIPAEKKDLELFN